jgi:hypothetical protein
MVLKKWRRFRDGADPLVFDGIDEDSSDTKV